jgi:hypothetical protein
LDSVDDHGQEVYEYILQKTDSKITAKGCNLVNFVGLLNIHLDTPLGFVSNPFANKCIVTDLLSFVKGIIRFILSPQ